MTPERESKMVERAIRNIPVEAIAKTIAAYEASERWLVCLVGGELELVHVDEKAGQTTWDDGLEYAQMVRWMYAHPERIYPTYQAALAFVR